ncbi:hypothetical protein Tco_0183753 [Tanacetum coccineum]
MAMQEANNVLPFYELSMLAAANFVVRHLNGPSSTISGNLCHLLAAMLSAVEVQGIAPAVPQTQPEP